MAPYGKNIKRHVRKLPNALQKGSPRCKPRTRKTLFLLLHQRQIHLRRQRPQRFQKSHDRLHRRPRRQQNQSPLLRLHGRLRPPLEKINGKLYTTGLPTAFMSRVRKLLRGSSPNPRRDLSNILLTEKASRQNQS